MVPRSSFERQAQICAKDLAVQCPIQTLALPPSFLSVINCVEMMAVNPWNIGFGILKFGMKECESKCSDKTSNKSNLWSIISLFPIVLSFELGPAWIRCTCQSFVHIASNQFACFSVSLNVEKFHEIRKQFHSEVLCFSPVLTVICGRLEIVKGS